MVQAQLRDTHRRELDTAYPLRDREQGRLEQEPSQGADPIEPRAGQGQLEGGPVELTFEAPASGGTLKKFHYSMSVVPDSTGYQPRKADNRVGYFTTTHMDIGHPGADTPWIRYATRWKLEVDVLQANSPSWGEFQIGTEASSFGRRGDVSPRRG